MLNKVTAPVMEGLSRVLNGMFIVPPIHFLTNVQIGGLVTISVAAIVL
jgi:hypothetical protein